MPGPPASVYVKQSPKLSVAPMPSLAVSPPPAHRASRQILIDSDDVDLRIAEKPERVHVAVYGNGRVPTLSYGHGLLRAIRVERFVERSSGRFQRSGCRQCDLPCYQCS